MQDRYTGDIGDYGKYGLLRFLSGISGKHDDQIRLSLASNWFEQHFATYCALLHLYY